MLVQHPPLDHGGGDRVDGGGLCHQILLHDQERSEIGPEQERPRVQSVVKLIATGLGSGYLKPFAGTWGTIPAWLIAWFLLRDSWLAQLAACGVVFVVSVWASGAAEKLFGHDARKIVIDEWVGMLLTVVLLPPTLPYYIAAFFAFRLFDVVKIPPARQLEELPGGWGVT
ncbi:hypothetical protein GF377_06590, partial [candidate division GN15 bacterium]|nr:hypothetical protein [candidate division GN15 bacterium]